MRVGLCVHAVMWLSMTFSASACGEVDSLCDGRRFYSPDLVELLNRSTNGLTVYDGQPLVYYAAVLGRTEQLRSWLHQAQQQRSVPQQILLDSVFAGQTAAVEILLTGGVDPNQSTPDGITPLMVAAQCGRVEIARFLVRHGANVNSRASDGMDALIAAVMAKSEDLVELLLDSGFDMERSRTKNGLTPMQLADKLGAEQIRRLLVHREGVQAP